MQTGLSLSLVALLGLLPYVSTIKLPPIATFWPEWVAVVLAGSWLASLVPASKPGIASATSADMEQGSAGVRTELAVPAAVFALVAAGAVLLAQTVAHRPLFVGAPMLAIAVLALATVVCLGGAKVRARGEAAKLLDAWSTGLLVAFALNVIAVVLDRNGLFVYIYQIVPRPPQARADGLIGQPNQLAVLAVLSSLAADYLWMRGRLPSIVRVLGAGAIAAVVAMSGSRAGALLWVVAAVLNGLALRSHPRRIAGWRMLALGVVMFVAAQVAWSTFNTAKVENIDGPRVLNTENRERIELLRDSWSLIKLHPLAGVGYGNFMAARWSELSGSLLEPTNGNAHNLIAQVMVELGMPGAVMVLLPLGLALWACAKVICRRELAAEQFLAAAVVLVLAGYSMFEYPLWHTYFLLPFALMLGMVDQRDRIVRVSAVTPPVRWLLWSLGATLCIALAFDYRRSENLYMSLRAQNHARITSTIEIQQASDIALLSAFDFYGNLMYSRTLEPDGSFMDEKLAITEKAMLSMTGRETIARHMAFLVAAGDVEAAKRLLLRTRRAPGLERATRATLELLVPKVPALRAFIDDLPSMPAP